MERTQSLARNRLFIGLWFACIVGAWSMFPYASYLGLHPSTAPLWKIFLFTTLQAAVVFGFACGMSRLLVPRTNLSPFAAVRSFYPAVISGLLVGLLIRLLESTLFASSVLSTTHPPAWAGALASIYGAVNEEVLLRLFLFTLLYFFFAKIFRFGERGRPYFLWTTNIMVALLFGLGHLPAAFKLVEPSVFELLRVLLLNGVAGIVFGWLYWTRGLWSAMAAHFVTDLIIHLS